MARLRRHQPTRDTGNAVHPAGVRRLMRPPPVDASRGTSSEGSHRAADMRATRLEPMMSPSRFHAEQRSESQVAQRLRRPAGYFDLLQPRFPAKTM
jgi:hypothetical protein